MDLLARWTANDEYWTPSSVRGRELLIAMTALKMQTRFVCNPAKWEDTVVFRSSLVLFEFFFPPFVPENIFLKSL
jgi:hypothetical protein